MPYVKNFENFFEVLFSRKTISGSGFFVPVSKLMVFCSETCVVGSRTGVGVGSKDRYQTDSSSNRTNSNLINEPSQLFRSNTMIEAIIQQWHTNAVVFVVPTMFLVGLVAVAIAAILEK